MYMKDGDIADYIESYVAGLRDIGPYTPHEDVLRKVRHIADALEDLAKDVREG